MHDAINLEIMNEEHTHIIPPVSWPDRRGVEGFSPVWVALAIMAMVLLALLAVANFATVPGYYGR